MKKYFLLFAGICAAGNALASTGGGTTVNISSGTKVVGSGAVQVTMSNTSFVNNGTYTDAAGTMNASTVTFSGTGATTLYNLNSAASSTNTCNSVVAVANLVSVGASGTLAAGGTASAGNLTLMSTASGNARVDVLPAGASVTGNVNVQQYFIGRRAYRFFGHPFSVSIPLSQLETYIDITGSGGATNGFTTTTTNTASAMWYNTTVGNPAVATATIPDPGWTAFTNTNGAGNNAFKQYEGINLFIRGAKGTGLDGTAYTPAAVTSSMTGTINQGTQTITLKKFPHSDYNQVSNPYPSPVDVGSAISAAKTAGGNIFGTAFFIWNPYRATAGAFVAVTIGGSYKIEGNTSFQVEALNTTGSTLTFHESDKVTSADTVLLRTANQYVALEVLDANNNVWDDLKIKFDAQATDAREDNDAGKPTNPDLNFYTIAPAGDHMSIDARPYADGKIIPLGLTTQHQQDFVIRATDLAAPVGAQVYLHDKYLASYTPLTQGTEYPFTVNSDVNSQGDVRFEIGLGAIPAISDAVVATSFSMTVTPNPATSQVVLNYQTSGKDNSHVRVLNAAGVEVTALELGIQASGNVTIPVSKLPAGIYLIELTSGNAKTTQRLVKD